MSEDVKELLEESLNESKAAEEGAKENQVPTVTFNSLELKGNVALMLLRIMEFHKVDAFNALSIALQGENMLIKLRMSNVALRGRNKDDVDFPLRLEYFVGKNEEKKEEPKV